MARERRTGDLKIYVPPSIEETLKKLAENQRRSISTYCYQVLEEHVAMTIFKQKISGAGRTN